MSWTTNRFIRLSPLILPYLVLFCGGVFLTVSQSLGVLTPLPHDGGALDAYARLLADRSFFASFAFSLGVVILLAMFSYPYMFRALVAGFQTMGEAYHKCARNLGAGTLAIALQVELPLLIPAMVAGGSVVFLVAFSEYFLVFLIGGGSVPSFTGTLFPLLSSSNRSLAAILTLIFLFLPILLFLAMDTAVVRIYRKKGMI